jgi:hypothetical protein
MSLSFTFFLLSFHSRPFNFTSHSCFKLIFSFLSIPLLFPLPCSSQPNPINSSLVSHPRLTNLFFLLSMLWFANSSATFSNSISRSPFPPFPVKFSSPLQTLRISLFFPFFLASPWPSPTEQSMKFI